MYYIFQLIPLFISLCFYVNYEIYSTMFLIISSISSVAFYLIYRYYNKTKAYTLLIYPIISSIVFVLLIYDLYQIKYIKLTSGFYVFLFSIILSISIYLITIFLNKIKTNKKKVLVTLMVFALMICWYNFKTISYVNCYLDNNIDYSYLKLNKPKDEILELCLEIKFNNFSYRKYENITVCFADEYVLPDYILYNKWDNLLPWYTSIKPFRTEVLKYYIPVNSKTVIENELLNKLSGEVLYIKNNNKVIGEITITQ